MDYFKVLRNDNEISVYKHTSSNTMISVFKLEMKDVENYDVNAYLNGISNLFKNSSSNVKFRFIFSSEEMIDGHLLSREEILKYQKIIRTDLYLIIEKSKNINGSFSFFKKESTRVDKFIDEINISQLSEIFNEIKPVSPNVLPKVFYEDLELDIQSNKIKIQNGNQIKLLKLSGLSEASIDINQFAISKLSTGLNFSFVTTIEPKSKTFSELFFRRRRKKHSTHNTLSDVEKQVTSEHTLKDVELNNEKLVNFESFIVAVQDLNLDDFEFEKSFKKLHNEFSHLANFTNESVGLPFCLKSCQIGTHFHLPQLELASRISPYIPAITFGDGSIEFKQFRHSSLPLLRRDNTLTQFDLFNPHYALKNFAVIGRSGRGKSVFAGLLLDSLSKEPETEIIIVDVRSSHTNTVERLNGKTFNLSLNNPTGFNPFKLVSNDKIQRHDKISLLSEFVCSLIKLNQNDDLIKIKSEVESVITAYIDNNPKNPSIHEFLKENKEIPKYEQLKRFGHKGIYENIFKECSNLSSSKITYYDIADIHNAKDTTFANAVISGVLFDFTVSVKSDSSKNKLLLIDEVPFFLTNNFEFFKDMASNIRKTGGAIGLIAQRSSDLVPDGKHDVLSQFPTKFIFSTDNTKSVNMSNLDINEYEYEQIKQLRSKNRIFSEVFFKDEFGSKILNIELTPKEYWKLTTDNNDLNKIKELSNFLPSFSPSEVLKLLGEVG